MPQEESASLFATHGLITAAIILNGFPAGGNIDWALVQLPAWRKY